MRKLAVVFPGIGYHTDKPLLYYSKKLAAKYGFEVVEVPYGNFPSGVKGSPEKMKQAFESALSQTREILKDIRFEEYDKILFLSKSVGTAVAAAYAKEKKLQTCNVFYTPVEASMELMEQPGIVFHGTNDSWARTSILAQGCETKGYSCYFIENANHSLETGDVRKDLENMAYIMERTEVYIKSISV